MKVGTLVRIRPHAVWVESADCALGIVCGFLPHHETIDSVYVRVWIGGCIMSILSDYVESL